MQSAAQSNEKSTQKRNPGYAPIRRGLLEHWPEMSVNARSLYIWLHLKAHFLEPKRGWVEASFDDMARGNDWSLKTLQRAIEELEAKPYIEIERAANQYGLTRVKILKYDPEECTSAVDKSVYSSRVGMDRAQDAAVDKSVHSAVHSKPGTTQGHQDLHATKNAVEVKKSSQVKIKKEEPVHFALPDLTEKQSNPNPSREEKPLHRPDLTLTTVLAILEKCFLTSDDVRAWLNVEERWRSAGCPVERALLANFLDGAITSMTRDGVSYHPIALRRLKQLQRREFSPRLCAPSSSMRYTPAPGSCSRCGDRGIIVKNAVGSFCDCHAGKRLMFPGNSAAEKAATTKPVPEDLLPTVPQLADASTTAVRA